jgi:hypothetical protein
VVESRTKEDDIMQLSNAQKEALTQGRAMPILVDQTECVLVRRDVYEQLHADY